MKERIEKNLRKKGAKSFCWGLGEKFAGGLVDRRQMKHCIEQ